MSAERFETIIIGGGQAGLVAGYHLARRNRPFVILDANERIGDSWRKRWASLRLFSPARFDGLPGLRYPAPWATFPTKDEMADYLEAYAERFDLPVRTGVRVDRLAREGDCYVVAAGELRFEGDHVIVASGSCQVPKIPGFSAELSPEIVQLHSRDYQGPAQLRPGGVLVVGFGNSGAEIAIEVARTHPTWVSGEPSGEIPVRHGPVAARLVFPVIRFAGMHVLNLRTPIGRKAQPHFVRHAAPLIRVKRKDIAAAGIEQVTRTVGVRDGLPELADGRVLDVSNVIWCTGFRPGFGWIDLPVFDEDGRPVQDRGVVTGEPGLYFVGVKFQYAAASDVLPGVGRDAAHVVKHLAARVSTKAESALRLAPTARP